MLTAFTLTLFITAESLVIFRLFIVFHRMLNKRVS